MSLKNNSTNRFKNQYVGRLKCLFKVTQLDNWVQGSTPNSSGSKVYTLICFTNYGHPLSSKGKQQQWQNKHQPLYFMHFLLSQLGHEYTGCYSYCCLYWPSTENVKNLFYKSMVANVSLIDQALHSLLALPSLTMAAHGLGRWPVSQEEEPMLAPRRWQASSSGVLRSLLFLSEAPGILWPPQISQELQIWS